MKEIGASDLVCFLPFSASGVHFNRILWRSTLDIIPLLQTQRCPDASSPSPQTRNSSSLRSAWRFADKTALPHLAPSGVTELCQHKHHLIVDNRNGFSPLPRLQRSLDRLDLFSGFNKMINSRVVLFRQTRMNEVT
jgi:hypothetical protein